MNEQAKHNISRNDCVLELDQQKLINTNSTKFRCYYLAAVFIFYLWYQATMNVLYTGTLFAYRNFLDFAFGFSINFCMILILSLLNTAIIYCIKWRRNKGWRIAADLVLSQAAPVIVNLIFLVISALFHKRPQIMWLQGFVLNFMIFMINEVVWYIINYKNSQYLYQNTLRIATQLEYNVLRAQVNPHFLFNSLNILYSLSHIDIEKSQQFILSLSKMYRYIIAHHESSTIPLSDEMEFLGSYVDVLKMLYYDSLEVHILKQEQPKQRQVIPYSLQLLIENVTKHNVIHKGNPMVVDIVLCNDHIVVSNPINLKYESTDHKSSGVGLLYLTKLYQLYGKEFKYQTTNDNRFQVEVPYI